MGMGVEEGFESFWVEGNSSSEVTLHPVVRTRSLVCCKRDG